MAEISVFISYKHEFKYSADRIREAIEYVDNDHRLEIFMDSDIPPGKKWLDWIKCHIGKSNILLFLFSEPSANWDWCLFEAGMFLSTGDSAKRVVCIHHPDFLPPDQLKDLQSIPADPATMQNLLVELFTKTDLTNLSEPLYPNEICCWKKIQQSAETICREFIPKKIDRHDYVKYVDIEIRQTNNHEGTSIPDEWRIEAPLESMEIFGLDTTHLSWREFVQSVSDLGDKRWLNELQDKIIKAINKKKFKPVSAILSGWDGLTYIPVISTADFFSNGSVKLHVNFVNNVSSKIMELPTPLGVLQTCLSIGTRFRYEVLIKCKSFVSTPHPDDEVAKFFNTMQNSIESVEREAKSRGLLSPAAIVEAFREPEEQARILSIIQGWQSLKANLLDKIRNNQLDHAEAVLNEIIVTNSRFLLMAGEQYIKILKGLVSSG